MKYIVLLTFCFIFIKCNSQTDDMKGELNEPINILSPATPFNLKRDNIFSSLPDSLGGSKVDGFAILTVYIDSSSILRGFEIVKLKIKQKCEGDIILNFVNEKTEQKPFLKEDYPKEVGKYYNVIKDYIDKLSFERNYKEPLNPLNKLTFMVRFN